MTAPSEADETEAAYFAITPALVARLGRLVFGDALGDLLVGELTSRRPAFDVESDLVAVVDRRDRAAPDRLRRDMPRHQPARGTREAAIGEQRHLVADPLADQRRGHLEHLAHAGAAGGALVADHDHVAGVDALLAFTAAKHSSSESNTRAGPGVA